MNQFSRKCRSCRSYNQLRAVLVWNYSKHPFRNANLNYSTLDLTKEDQNRIFEVNLFTRRPAMAKDKFHEVAKNALINDGWTITHDPYKIMLGRRRGYIDLGAELISARAGLFQSSTASKSTYAAAGLHPVDCNSLGLRPLIASL